jgi:uncharacterized protein (TIGR02271 family)
MSAKRNNQNSSNNQQDANRDPITGEPRSHPLGTGAGAALGGAAAGAAAGSVAGPVGTGIGAAAGAIAGGLGGKAVAEHFNPTEAGELRRFIDYKVIDQNNDGVGSVDAVWEDHTGQPTYLAVRTGWLGMGKAHIVPAEAAQVNERDQRIRLPYTAEQIKNAPSFDSQDDITEQSDFTISCHFGTKPRWAREEPRASTAPRESVKDANIKLKQEELKVGKREVEYGGVRLRKIVRTEVVNQPVELSREEIVIERVPLSGGQATTSDTQFGDEEIYIPLRREEAVVEKTTRAREEVRVGKRRETEQETIHEEIRHEDVEIEHDHEHEEHHTESRR